MSRYSWLITITAVVTLMLLALVQEVLLKPLGFWRDTVLTLALAGLAGIGLSWVATGGIRRVRAALARHSEKLVSAPARELNRDERPLPTLLQGIVEAARELTGARCGVLELEEPQLVLNATEPGRGSHENDEGAGLLTAVAKKYQVRFGDLSGPAIPLSAPIVSAGDTIGTLTLREKTGGLPFGPEDQALLRWCAMRVALCIEDDRRRRRLKEQAIAEERERIAREMHDSLAQVLGYINTKAQVARELVCGGRTDQARAQLDQLVTVAHTACGDVREEILALRATPNPGESMLESLCDYLQRWQHLTGVGTQLDISSVPAALPLAPEARLQLFRIIQAALSNVRSHAAAGRVQIQMRSGREWLETTIEDDGVGFDTHSERVSIMPRFGLVMMRERAESVGGELEVSSAPREGTRVVVRLPVKEKIEQKRYE